MPPARRIRIESATPTSGVTVLELFFDLVFVYAMTQVTALLASDLTVQGVVRGLLVLTVVWWTWVGYSWVGNLVRADEGTVRLAMFVAMGGVFAMALTIPEAFDDAPGGLSGPVVLAFGYLWVRAVHFWLFWQVSRDDPALRRQLATRFAPAMLGGTTLLLVASQLSGGLQLGAWVVALLVDYLGTYLSGDRGWRLTSPAHFAERHGLVIILTLGEAIVAIGVGVGDRPVSTAVLVGSGLGLAVACALWWLYFDVMSPAVRERLAAVEGKARIRLARDTYTFLHLPLVGGIVLVALGMEEALHHVSEAAVVGEGAEGSLAEPLPAVATWALFGGVALYVLALVAVRYRTMQVLSVRRLVVAGVTLALAPLAALLPALAAQAVAAVVVVSLVAYEAVRFAGRRYAIRHADQPE